MGRAYYLVLILSFPFLIFVNSMEYLYLKIISSFSCYFFIFIFLKNLNHSLSSSVYIRPIISFLFISFSNVLLHTIIADDT